MKNPFFTVGEAELIFDNDLTVEGAAIGFNRALGIVEPFFYVQERSAKDDSWLLGAQGSLKSKRRRRLDPGNLV